MSIEQRQTFTVCRDGYNPRTTIATTAEQAAIDLGATNDYNGETASGEGSYKVTVTDEDSNVTRWEVDGEMVPIYEATEIRDK